MAVPDDKKKYKPLEKVLNQINKDFISLSDEDIKRNNAILGQLLELLTKKMKTKDNLFKEMYSRVFYGGSYYDNLRVGQPDEFDLDLLLTLPKLSNPCLMTSNVPGYVHLQLKDLATFNKQTDLVNRYKVQNRPNPTIQRKRTPNNYKKKNFRGLDKLLDDKHFLDNQKVRQWMERVVTLTLNDFKKEGAKYILEIQKGTFYAKIHKAGPAFTLKVNGTADGKEICLDIDLVPCFEFKKEQWPKEGFKPNPVSSKPNFFIVPKPIKDAPGKINQYWRLSFQEQERELMEKKQYLKPTVKLIKKMRDVLDHKCIASYYIKTVALQEIDKPKSEEFWSCSQSFVFITILRQYYECINKKKIQYFWNKNNNLIHNTSNITLENIANKLKIILEDIEKHLDDPRVVAKYLLTTKELKQFQM